MRKINNDIRTREQRFRVEAIQTKLEFYKRSGLKAHVLFKSMKGKTFYNGVILEHDDVMFYIDDTKYGKQQIFYQDVLVLEIYKGKQETENKPGTIEYEGGDYKGKYGVDNGK